MKTLTTLTAVAALIAAMSIASAQMSPPSTSSGSTGASGTMGNSKQAIGTGKFCIETAPGGALNCKYASLAACQQDAKANSRQCAPNPYSGTTGAK